MSTGVIILVVVCIIGIVGLILAWLYFGTGLFIAKKSPPVPVITADSFTTSTSPFTYSTTNTGTIVVQPNVSDGVSILNSVSPTSQGKTSTGEDLFFFPSGTLVFTGETSSATITGFTTSTTITVFPGP